MLLVISRSLVAVSAKLIQTTTRFSCRVSLSPRRLSTMSVSTTPYGSWKSPISSTLVSESAVNFQELHLDLKLNVLNPDKADTVYWSELRYEEGGRYVVCSNKHSEQGFVSWTPDGFNARTRVHEYGGGSFFVHNGTVYFTNFKDQRLYKQTAPTATPEAITPDNSEWRYADAQLHNKTGVIYSVREDHGPATRGEAKEAVNTVVSINPSTQIQSVLASGADFYSSPRVSPDGRKLAWIQWNHPNMPWDSTELWEADMAESGETIVPDSAKMLIGGSDVSVILPSWTPDNELLYVSDKTNWWNLYHVASTGEHIQVLPRDQEQGVPLWIFGNATYAVDPKGSGDVVILSGTEMGIVNLKSGQYQVVNTGFTEHKFLTFSASGDIACVAGGPTQFSCVVHIHPNISKVHAIRKSKELSLDEAYFSVPTAITWPTGDGTEVSHGYFYPPQNKDFQAPTGELPPLLVKAHGGPTGHTCDTLNLKIQYFTSRGFGVLDVNYRGSTGYGKKYRDKLRGKWGILDIEDCCSGAQYLVKDGKVDGKRLCIDGGSAGGYTTLGCLTFKPDVFNAGASHYGVADLEALATDTHKFESRYLDSMIGPYSGDGIQLYKDRSPINFTDKLNCAIAFFQGDEDKIVLPNQAEMMYNAVKAKNLPTVYILFKGEQHGFRKAENIQKALDGEFYFFSRVFGFEAADKGIELLICNM